MSKKSPSIVAIVAESADSFKIYGPLLYRLFERAPDFRVTCYCVGTKIDMQMAAPGLSVHFHKIELKFFNSIDTALRDILDSSFRVAISICPRAKFGPMGAQLARRGVHLMALPYLGEELWYAIQAGESLNVWHKIFLSNPRVGEGLKLALKHKPWNFEAESRFGMSGNIELDQLSQIKDPSEFLKLPEDDYALVSTFAPFYCAQWSTWQKIIYRNSFSSRWPMNLMYGSASKMLVSSQLYPSKISIWEVLAWMKDYAKNNGLKLVAKSREKHHRDAEFTSFFDQVYTHSCFYPFNSLFLCQRAQIFMGMFSAMTTEALSVGIPAMNFFPLDMSKYNRERGAPGQEWGIWDHIMIQEGGLYNQPPYSQRVNLFEGDPRQKMRELASRTPSDLTPSDQQRALIHESIGFVYGEGRQASDQVIDEILKVL